jgi:hypothetical protein
MIKNLDKVMFEAKVWEFNTRLHWNEENDSLSNAGLVRENGSLLEYKRLGVSFKMEDLQIIQ